MSRPMKWSTIWPSVEDEDEYFLVSDGIDISIARFENLCKYDPDCGADWDEQEFNNGIYPYVEPKFWYGPIKFHMQKNTPRTEYGQKP